ncbi:hypothetical protein L208DRAFT_741363 [Tricholoma matsutake]|nr:hypothetical protein L208DRAFT_741363 [Tricholoma matsutake 945]
MLIDERSRASYRLGCGRFGHRFARNRSLSEQYDQRCWVNISFSWYRESVFPSRTRVRICVVCVLSSDMDLSLWGPTKNRFQGEWTKVSNVA